jgi:uncharacterized protein YuzE
MRLTYDPRYNIAYLRFHEKPGAVETLHVSDELNIDLAPDGTIYGIELLNANEQLRGDDQGKFVVINEARDEHTELQLDISAPAAELREKPQKPYGST